MKTQNLIPTSLDERLEALRQAIREAGHPALRGFLINVFRDPEVRKLALGEPDGPDHCRQMVRSARAARANPHARPAERPLLYCAALVARLGHLSAKAEQMGQPNDWRMPPQEHLRLILRKPLSKLEEQSSYAAEAIRVMLGLGEPDLWGVGEAARLNAMLITSGAAG